MKKTKSRTNTYWRFNEQGDDDENIVVTVSEQYILDYYWPYWKEQMDKKFGPGHELTTEDNCIEDYVVVHWAWSVSEPQATS